MSGRILVVDDVAPNVRLLKAKLEAEYYDVLTAENGPDAIEIARHSVPDLILLDVMMPQMDGYEVCTHLKNDPLTRHIPVVMVTALDEQEDRVRGLEVGADDFLSKPIDDVALFARVRSLLRLKLVMDELRQREASGRAMGAISDSMSCFGDSNSPANILILEDDRQRAERLASKLHDQHNLTLSTDPREAAEMLGEKDYDLLVINLAARGFDGLRLCARIRSRDRGRAMPILALVNPDSREQIVKALDIGVNDVLLRPVDANEFSARVKTQLRCKRYADTLRQSLDSSFEMSVTDQLTGLHNRRFMQARLEDALARLEHGVEPASVMIADVDFFKLVNDKWGHDAGDKVLQEIARRLKANMRAIDITCRYGGEEFVVVMPGADVTAAIQAAERLRVSIEADPFDLGSGNGTTLITMCAGVAELVSGDTHESALIRADQALYEAKSAGRNCVRIAKSTPAQSATG
ncbi:MAG: PleD family two-component system response regulator [Robiginitomaculum sp.]|nr:MAG: PleD family two-component system response regulator [Robiginitomaculum sp.]